MKKELKNPITIIRKPDEINKEYSEAVIEIGKAEVELSNITRLQEDQDERRRKIHEMKSKMFSRILQLAEEMNEAQKEIQRKKDEEIKPPEIKNEAI